MFVWPGVPTAILLVSILFGVRYYTMDCLFRLLFAGEEDVQIAIESFRACASEWGSVRGLGVI